MTSNPHNPEDELGHQIAMRLRAAYARMRRQSNLAFSEFGMTTDQFVLMTVLYRDGEASQQELVQRCFSDTATIGAMVVLLESKGLVSRKPHPEDGRAWSVELTATGQDLTKQMNDASSEIRIKLARLFSSQESMMFMEYLERLSGSIELPKRKSAIRKLSNKAEPRKIKK